MRPLLFTTMALFVFATSAPAAVIGFGTDPFEGSTALTTPGRQLVGGEIHITFDTATDVFAFDPDVFGVYGVTALSFVNDVAGNIPPTGVNVVVLRTFDNDNDPATPFGAGAAATLIANQITSPGAGFFIYFNSGLNLPRLVFSTDLSDNTADLKVLARLLNLTANQAGLTDFTAANFVIEQVPEPATLLMLALGGAIAVHRRRRKGSSAM
jgi:hypothetical protein